MGMDIDEEKMQSTLVYLLDEVDKLKQQMKEMEGVREELDSLKKDYRTLQELCARLQQFQTPSESAAETQATTPAPKKPTPAESERHASAFHLTSAELAHAAIVATKAPPVSECPQPRPAPVKRRPVHPDPPPAPRFTLDAAQAARVERVRRAYERLAPLTDIETLSEQRDAFLHDWQIVPFSCTNGPERITGAGAPPVFAATDSPFRADLWAAPVAPGLYAVFPRSPITYDGVLHTAGALGDIFDSNYHGGVTYDHASVQRPAIFRHIGGTWELLEKGRLMLR